MNTINIYPVINLMMKVGNNLLRWRKSDAFKKFEYKKKKEIVSSLDKKAEIELRKGIKKIFPDHKIWGEELGRDSGNLKKEKFIIIDPIDGSKNYLSNNPLFASQIACVEKNKILWGIINLPALKEVYWSISGKGAWCNKEKITPSTQKNLDLAVQCFGIGHSAKNFLKLPKLIENYLAEPRHYGCAGVHFSFVANGRTDIYIASEAAFYDMAAGLIICKEVGLKFCQLNGKPYQQNEKNKSLVIANKNLISQYKLLRKNTNINLYK